jgi:transposase
MFCGSFYGDSKGPTFFWGKDLGKINSERYIQYIRPLLYRFCQEHPGVIVMQDNAPSHRAKVTRETFAAWGIPLLDWPQYSPDLNPIEYLWKAMKDWIQRWYPEIITDLDELRWVVQRAWDEIGRETLYRNLASMPQRMRDVIAAEGGATKW